MPVKLGESGAIDRKGSGATPDIGSKFRLVDAIPRGSAWQWEWQLERFLYMGGRPRCPVCVSSKHVCRTHYCPKNTVGDFHCRKCRVGWSDVGQALCYICDQPFAIPKSSKQHYPWNRDSWEHGTSYHHNMISEPFCAGCRAVVGADDKHRRRQLRRMVGLR